MLLVSPAATGENLVAAFLAPASLLTIRRQLFNEDKL